MMRRARLQREALLKGEVLVSRGLAEFSPRPLAAQLPVALVPKMPSALRLASSPFHA